MEAVIIILLVVLLPIGISYANKVNKLSRDVVKLDDELRRLQRVVPPEQAFASSAALTAPPIAMSVPAAMDQMIRDATEVLVETSTPLPVAMAVQEATPSIVVPPRQPHAPSQAARRIDSAIKRVRETGEWEALIGGNWLNRIGAFALILGVAFFLKYAFENNWITHSLQIAIGLGIGLGLLGLARRSHGKGYTLFSQGLVGAGIAILYLSVYASSNVYHLVPQPAALAAMFAITALALVHALYYNSLAVAVLGWGGGFLTPFLLGTSAGSEAGLIAYVFLLAAGILSVVYIKDSWAVLEALTLGATYATYFVWYGTQYTSSKVALAVGAITLFWALFFARDVLHVARRTQSYRTMRQGMGVANVACYYLALVLLLGGPYRIWLGALTLVLGAIYAAGILALKGRLSATDWIDTRYVFTSIALLILATPILFSGFAVVILWSLEALVLLWLGIRSKLWYVWRPALAMYTLAALLLPATSGALASASIRSFTPLFNLRALAFITLAGALAVSIRLVGRLEDRNRQAIGTSLHYGWCALVFILLTVEIDDSFRRLIAGAAALDATNLSYLRLMALCVIWMAYSFPLVWFGLKRRVFPIVSSGLSAVSLSVCLGVGAGAAYQPIERFIPVANVRAAVLLLLVASLLLHIRLLTHNRLAYPWIGTVRTGLQAAVVLIGFVLLSAETNDFFRHRAGTVGEPTRGTDLFVEAMALATIWMMYSLLLVWQGVARTARTVLSGGLASSSLAVGAGAVAGIAFQPRADFGLVLSARAIVLPVLILGLFLQMRWFKERGHDYRWLDKAMIAFQASIVFLGFELVTGETRDFFQNVSVTGGPKPLGDSSTLLNLEQLTLSVIWLLYAVVVMGIGIGRRARWLRIGAFGLFGFIILKIFVYDLSFLQGLYRSISFAGLGVILLAVSYLYQRYRGLLLEA